MRFGPLTRHAEIEDSAIVAKVPILHDCAAGIADVQVRNRGTIGGSLAEADPSGDWAVVLSTLATQVRCLGKNGERTVDFKDFIKDAYTTVLAHDELVSEVSVKIPAKGSGGAYLAFKRAAPVYPTASAAVQLTMDGNVCKEVSHRARLRRADRHQSQRCRGRLARPVRSTEKTLSAAAEGASAAADPQSDMRGSADYKRTLVGALVKRAIDIAVRRARGEKVEVSHIYA